MGVEYIHYLIPKDRSFRPSAAQLVACVDALYAENWLCRPGSEAFDRLAHADMRQSSSASAGGCDVLLLEERSPLAMPLTLSTAESLLERDVILLWPFDNFGLVADTVHYPLLPTPESCEERYFDLKLQLTKDYLYRCSELIDPFLETRCKCGFELENTSPEYCGSPFYASRIHRNCPACGAAIDVSAWPAVVRDGWSGAEREVRGGVTSLFALAIDCGKDIPGEGETGDIRAQPELVRLLERVFEKDFDEYGDIY